MKTEREKKGRKPKVKSKAKSTSSFGELSEKYKNEKAPKQYWAGIINTSVGFIYGSAKSGKSILCENLAFAITSGQKSFLGLPIGLPKSKVLYISLEEDTKMRFVQRANEQKKGFSSIEIRRINRKLSYSNDNFIRSVSNNQHWELLENEIKDFKSNLIIIDSTNKFVYDIEQKLDANLIMQKFKDLAIKYECGIILIHHSVKSQTNQGLSLEKMSGSSALSRDADYFIGVNNLSNGTRYLRFVEGRYYPGSDLCKVISIQDNCLLELVNEEYEHKLLKSVDERYKSDNTQLIMDYINENVKRDEVFETKLLQSHFVDKEGIITKATMHNQIKKIEEMKIIKKVGHGKYKRIDKDTNT